MNAVQLHLLSNHVPLLGALFAALALAAGLVWRSRALRRFGLACLIGVALATAPVFFSGEPAEEWLEKSTTIPETIVERHEDSAKISAILLIALGAVALLVLLRSRGRDLAHGTVALVLLATLGVAGSVAWTAHLGGQIRHPEIRSDGAGTPNAAGAESTVPEAAPEGDPDRD